MRSFTQSLLIALFFATGCTAPQPKSNEPDLTHITQERIAELFYRMWCERGTRCLEWGGWSDVDYCTAATLQQYDTYLDAISDAQRSIEAGLTQFNPDAFRECLLEIYNLSCDSDFSKWNWRTNLPICGEAFTGMQGDGEPCISSASCSIDSLCTWSREDVCNSTCQKKGVGCFSNDSCRKGKICDASQRCRAPISPPGTEGMPCGEYQTCVAGLYCQRTSESGYVCRRLRGDGDSCAFSSQCRDGLFCGRSDSICHPVLPEVGENGPCGNWDDLDAPSCRHDLLCVPNDDGTDGRCIKPKKRGQSCTKLLECGTSQSNLICDTKAKQCVDRPNSGPCPAPELGDFCSPFESYCDRDTDPAHPNCRPFKAFGESCILDAECGNDYDERYCWRRPGSSSGTCNVALSLEQICTK